MAQTAVKPPAAAARAAPDRLLLFFSRLAQVGSQVHEARAHDAARHVDDLDSVPRQALADLGDAAVLDPEVALRVEALAGVDDPPPRQQQRSAHAETSLPPRSR
jgi:hypothetical protein